MLRLYSKHPCDVYSNHTVKYSNDLINWFTNLEQFRTHESYAFYEQIFGVTCYLWVIMLSNVVRIDGIDYYIVI